MIKAIIFDCFGVVYKDNFSKAYEHFGGDLEKDGEFIEQTFFDVSKGTLLSGTAIVADHLGISADEWKDYQAQVKGFNEKLLVYIKELRKTYKVGMLSNVGQSGLSSEMDYKVLEEHFDDIVESAKIGFAKPEARAFEIAAERLGVRLDECVFTDDRPNYVEGATHVGMQALLYKDFDSFKKELEGILEG